jgi:hypothetical protein
MGTSSRKLGPTFDGLRVTVQPFPDHVNYSVIRLHWEGSRCDVKRISSGALIITPQDMKTITAIGLIERVLDQMRAGPKGSPPPLGAMGEQLTLDLDSRH